MPKRADDVDQTNPSATEGGTPISTIPDTAEEGSLPSRYGTIVNLAKEKTLAPLCEQMRSWASVQIRRFEGQDQREAFVDTGGVMDIADRMWRVALNRDTTNSQTKDTLSDVTSPMFHIQVRAVTAGETSMLFADERLPAEYKPEINTKDYAAADGKRIAEHQNMLQELTFDEDVRIEKIKELSHYVNKYANQVVYHDWIRETQEVTENVPDAKGGVNENGTFKKFKRVTKNRVVKDWPTLRRIPIETCYYDAQIFELNDQICFAFKDRVDYGVLAGLARDGYIANVDKLTPAAFYQGEVGVDSPMEDRQTNAGEGSETDKTGELDLWTVWARVPIAQRTTKKKGVVKAGWDGAKNAPDIYTALYAGNIHSGKAVCLKLCKNPHWHKQIPAKLIHSHLDDKGAFHTGYSEMLQSLYHQACTNLNQAVDNVTERNWAPMTANGPVMTRDLTFRKNKLIQLDRSTEFKRLEVPDTTRITMEMFRIVEEQSNQLTGADKPIRAEALGSRTSATEAKNVFDQATQPLDEKASYFSDQLFPWLYELDASGWRQYGDPSTVLRITHNDTVVDVNPGELWGPIRTKVTAVTRFRNNTVQRQQINNFLQNVLPIFVPSIPKDGLAVLGRETFRMFGIEKLDEVFPPHQNFEAEAMATQALQTMLIAGQWVQPEPQENHDAWLPILEQGAAQYRLLPDKVDANEQMLLLHIQMRRDMSAQQKQAIQRALPAGGGAQQGLPGEQEANAVEAQEGALANA